MSGAGYSNGVVVIAVGARTAVGLSADASAAAWRAGISRVAEHPRFVDKGGEPVRVAMDAAIEPERGAIDRMIEMAEAALHEACECFVGGARPRALLQLALPAARAGWNALDARPVLERVGAAATRYVDVTEATAVPRGHAGGVMALEAAVRAIEAQSCDLCLVGGVDSWIDWTALEWLDNAGRLASDSNRLGFTPGEGAAFVIVASVARARALRLPALARIAGVGSAHETKTRDATSVCVGEALTQTIRDATAGLSLPDDKVVTTYCDINGERYRSEEFMYVPLRVWAPFVDANQFDTGVDAWGDVGAASGPLLVALAAVSGRRGWAKGSSVLVWTGSDSGERAAMSLKLAVGAAEGDAR